jgi:hypothetical protein
MHSKGQGVMSIVKRLESEDVVLTVRVADRDFGIANRAPAATAKMPEHMKNLTRLDLRELASESAGPNVVTDGRCPIWQALARVAAHNANCGDVEILDHPP